MDLTDRCNLACKMCEWKHKLSRKNDMDFDLYKSIIDEGKRLGLKDLLVGSVGEPLLYRRLPEALDYAKERAIRLGITTNLSMALSIELFSSLLDLDRLYVSIDGATKEVYEEIRVGSDFRKVIKNLTHFLNKRTHTKVIINYVIQRDNIEDVHKAAVLFSDMGVDEICFSSLDNRNYKDVFDQVKIEEEQFPVLLDQAKKAYDVLKRQGKPTSPIINPTFLSENKENFLDGIPPLSQEVRQIPCWQLWMSAYISAEGYVHPCCSFCGEASYLMGDLNTERLKNIWFSMEYRELRERFMRMRPRICEKCGSSLNIQLHKKIGRYLS